MWSLQEASWQAAFWGKALVQEATLASVISGWADRRLGILGISCLVSCLNSGANDEQHFKDFCFCHCRGYLLLFGPEASTQSLLAQQSPFIRNSSQWAVLLVWVRACDLVLPAWTYSVGFWTVNKRRVVLLPRHREIRILLGQPIFSVAQSYGRIPLFWPVLQDSFPNSLPLLWASAPILSNKFLIFKSIQNTQKRFWDLRLRTLTNVSFLNIGRLLHHTFLYWISQDRLGYAVLTNIIHRELCSLQALGNQTPGCRLKKEVWIPLRLLKHLLEMTHHFL